MIEAFGYEPKTHVAGVCEVVRTEMIAPHMRRITVHGTALTGLERLLAARNAHQALFPSKGTQQSAGTLSYTGG